jgi:DNA-binding response OmpR family regulator
MAQKHILIAEDEPHIVESLNFILSREGFAVTSAADGEAAFQSLSEKRPDLMILDVMLPKMTGLDVCKKLRGAGSGVPIIMLTARGQEIDKVLGLKLGADDYVTKPFGFMELLARVEAVLRRCNGTGGVHGALEVYRSGDLEVDFKRHEARRSGELLELSPREFELLEYFIRHQGEVVTREELLDSVWGYNAIPFTRTVDMHIAKLRKKIEDDPGNPKRIVTVHRLGYKFCA